VLPGAHYDGLGLAEAAIRAAAVKDLDLDEDTAGAAFAVASIDLEGDVVAVAENDELAVEGAVDRPVLGIAGIKSAGEALYQRSGRHVFCAVRAVFYVPGTDLVNHLSALPSW
jgi:hypothetical protein